MTEEKVLPKFAFFVRPDPVETIQGEYLALLREVQRRKLEAEAQQIAQKALEDSPCG